MVIYLGFFILATAFLFDQGIPLTLYQCVGAVVLVAALVGLQQSPARNDPWRALRSAAGMLLQALPLMLLTYTTQEATLAQYERMDSFVHPAPIAALRLGLRPYTSRGSRMPTLR